MLSILKAAMVGSLVSVSVSSANPSHQTDIPLLVGVVLANL